MKTAKKKISAKYSNKKRVESVSKIASSEKYFFISIGKQTYKAPTSKLKEVIKATGGKLIELPSTEDLTTQEVADLLNVSRPYVVSLIDKGELKGFHVGNHRRVKRADAMAYKAKMRNEQEDALAELLEESQKLGLDF